MDINWLIKKDGALLQLIVCHIIETFLKRFCSLVVCWLEIVFFWNTTLSLEINDHKWMRKRNTILFKELFFKHIKHFFFLFRKLKKCYNHTCAFMLHTLHLHLFKTIISIRHFYSRKINIICQHSLQIYHHKSFQSKLVFIIISDWLLTITDRVNAIRVQSHIVYIQVCQYHRRGRFGPHCGGRGGIFT